MDELVPIRNLYLSSTNDANLVDSATVLLNDLPSEFQTAPIATAFDGALIVMEAKHAFWPGKKLAYVRRGLRKLDQAVEEDDRNAEVRYLRLISCYYLPGLFGRKWSVEEDFRVLSQTVTAMKGVVSNEFYRDLVKFVLDNGKPETELAASLKRELELIGGSSAASER